MITKVCQYCGKPFQTNNKDKKYCSKQCMIDVQKKEYPIKRCPNCGKEFQNRHKKVKFCCLQCSVDYHKKNPKPQNMVTLVCQMCKKEFQVPYGRRNQKTCSSQCKNLLIGRGRKVPRVPSE